MRSLLLLLIALAALCTPSFAQVDAAEFKKQFDQGIADLTAGKLDSGIEIFKKCLELKPEHPTCAYNIACGYSKKGEKEPAFEWLEKAATWGFGNLDSQLTAAGPVTSNVTLCEQDADLVALHEDPRWPKLIERMSAARKALLAFEVNSAAVYVPKALEGASEFPVLVVLHGENQNKQTVIQGRWKRIADELGCALVAPSGRFPANALDLGAGMRWFESPASYAASPRLHEVAVSNALTAFQKDHKLAADRVWIAGEGYEALLAFNIAVGKSGTYQVLGKPGTYKAVLVINGPIDEKTVSSKAAAAAKIGLRVHAIESAEALVKYLGDAAKAKAWVDGLQAQLTAWGLVSKVESFEIKPGEPDPIETMALAALRSVPTAPIEAGTGK